MEVEPPECPVCLQPYDAASVIPRVLTCGHTTCEPCLKQLPNPFLNTIRCTVCTLLVKFPNSPSSLPKNLDLLHFSSILQRDHGTGNENAGSQSSPAEIREKESSSFPVNLKSWSYELYCKWKKWILPEDCILIKKLDLENDGAIVFGKIVKSYEPDHAIGSAGLVKVGVFVEGEEDSRVFRASYESRIMTVLCGMKEENRNGLWTILGATQKVSNVGKIYGFWYNEDDNCVYMVCEKLVLPNLKTCMLEKHDNENGRLISDEMSELAMIGMETCEILNHLHLEGIVAGFLTLNSLCFNEFDRVYVDLIEIFNTGKEVNTVVQKAYEDKQFSLKDNLMDKNLVFICPEMLLELYAREGLLLDIENSKYKVGCISDVWSLACLLVWLIVGNSFVEEWGSFLNSFGSVVKDGGACDYSDFHISWMERVVALLESRLGSEYASLQEILCRCLAFDPVSRPHLIELWKSLRNLVVKQRKYGSTQKKDQEVQTDKLVNFVVLAELSQLDESTDKALRPGLTGKDEKDQSGFELRTERDISTAVSSGHFRCAELKGHLDCITGLAIAGDFLFSSSYDKMINVWSLKDFKPVQSFKGHEHRVTAVVALNGEQPLCISSDNEGVICIWKASFPFSDVPIRKLYEKKDWRYSGIQAMAVSGTEHLYTGGGDKLVKAWSLQDYTISNVMSGHKSVVSSLLVCDGVLYSGSWDGTVRLWSLSDHSPLTVLGEEKTGNIYPVLCLSAEHPLLFVGHEKGCIKIWHNDLLLKSMQTHKGAIFSITKKGRWLFSGGWNKTINLQEISEGTNDLEATPIGSIACDSTITALLYWQGKLFVGQADKTIKVYHGV